MYLCNMCYIFLILFICKKPTISWGETFSRKQPRNARPVSPVHQRADGEDDHLGIQHSTVTWAKLCETGIAGLKETAKISKAFKSYIKTSTWTVAMHRLYSYNSHIDLTIIICNMYILCIDDMS